jgi:hypothetical protein
MRVRIRRERLVVPGERLSPIDRFIHLARRLGEHLLKHQVVVDRRHAPDDGFDGATVGCALGQLSRGNRRLETVRLGDGRHYVARQ